MQMIAKVSDTRGGFLRKAVITIFGSIFGVQHASLRVTRAQ